MIKTLNPETSNVVSENNKTEFTLFDADLTKKAAAIMRAMNHKLRHTILTFIDNAGSTNVTAIYKALNIEQSVASQHLAIMRRAKIVIATRTGKQILYSVNHDRINLYMNKVKEILA
ncbi:hypothetical protein LBMAG27_07240 [Bacteroidota bacterium]|nr:hypothetical protein LBMAG27_07240 [Bacteroidota bacterium]